MHFNVVHVDEAAKKIHNTNLVIEARNATLDVERDNTEWLFKDIQKICDQWDTILLSPNQ